MQDSQSLHMVHAQPVAGMVLGARACFQAQDQECFGGRIEEGRIPCSSPGSCAEHVMLGLVFLLHPAAEFCKS